MKRIASQTPLFVFLLPVFFVFHRYVENAGYVSFTACLPLLGVYLLAALVIYGIFFLFMKHPGRAALLTVYVLSFYLFFGVLHDLLRKNAIFLHRYSLLLPAFAVSVVILALLLRKRTGFSRAFLFLNTLLVLYLLVDGFILLGHWARQRPPASMTSALADRYGVGADRPRPDIYLLLFDEYSASRTLKEVYHYDNSGLDSFLRKEGFRILAQSRSNYYMTPFSMASILNISYLEGIPEPMNLQPDDYLGAIEKIGRSEVVKFLAARGYTIVNNSPFDLPGHPARIDQPFIPSSTRLITHSTLYDYLCRDVGATLDELFHDHRSLVQSDVARTFAMNNRFLDDTRDVSRQTAAAPRFIYMHVLMPHLPYFYDSLCNRRPPEEVDRSLVRADPARYCEYLPYTNARIRQIIREIKVNSKGNAVILFLSDHGLRYDTADRDHPWFFNNQNAVYFPDGDASLFYDSISGVNQFRVVFNKLFGLHLPLLKDSSIFLHDRPDQGQNNNRINP